LADEQISGEVVRVTHRNPETDWSVLRVNVKGHHEARTVNGFSGAQPGQVITATGKWENNKHGRVFTASQIVAASPSTPAGLTAYLGSGVVKGVGPKMAAQLVTKFGMDVVRVLDDEPERLSEIRGIGATTIEKIVMAWGEQRKAQEIMVFLHSQEITAALCRRIYKAYGDDAIAKISANPYQMCMDVRGVGFKTADAIGQNLAVPLASSHRIQAGMLHLMQEHTTSGHCGSPRAGFITKVAEALGVERARVSEVLDETLGLSPPVFVQHGEEIYLASLSKSEEFVSRRLRQLLSSQPAFAARATPALIERAATQCNMVLAKKQRVAVEMGLKSKVCVITGGPGCGKTATLKVLLAAYKAMKLSVALAAPTGKAAQRAREATGIEAMTVHRLLGLKGGYETEPSLIHADVLVIDECSMIDVPLMAKIMAAVQSSTSVVLVGDVDQLPSVGPGQVLGDIIRSSRVPVTVLNEIFRQAAGSFIITNAHAINRGESPQNAPADGDFFVMTERNTPSIRTALELEDETEIPAAVAEAVACEIEQLVAIRLPAKYGYNPIADIQVLSPMNKGGCGVHALNVRLQQALNPNPPDEKVCFGVRFGVRDKVIQVKNNYDLEVFNGDVGIVTGVDHKDDLLRVNFDGRTVAIPFDNLDELRLAYAMTIHKSQGSQAPAIVIPMVTQHWTMLQRNLIYTGVTRAKSLAVLVGQTRAIAAAVRTVSSTKRLTRLAGLLASEEHPEARQPRRPPAQDQRQAIGW
jgi:exodeoxyribonuclease V alpha subunit